MRAAGTTLSGGVKMSEQGWRVFLQADGVDDWVVLHGGAAAVFRVPSILDAARLGRRAGRRSWPGRFGRAADVVGRLASACGSVATCGTSRRTTSSWREPCQPWLEPTVRSPIVPRCRRCSWRSPRKPDAVDLEFWRAALGYGPMADDNAVDPLGHGSTVWMQQLDPAKPLRHAMHVDVSVAREHVSARLDAALAAGGRIVDESPEHWTLSDVPATECASAPGPTASPCGSPTLAPSTWVTTPELNMR